MFKTINDNMNLLKLKQFITFGGMCIYLIHSLKEKTNENKILGEQV